MTNKELYFFQKKKDEFEKKHKENYRSFWYWTYLNSRVIQISFFIKNGYWPKYKPLGTLHSGFVSYELVDLSKPIN